MRRIALTFVHGIRNGPTKRSVLEKQLEDNLERFKVLDLFMVPESSEKYVSIAEWNSIGDFVMDLAALTKQDWREDNIKSIRNKFMKVQAKILSDSEGKKEELPIHVIVMHSMGQPLGICALVDMTTNHELAIPTVAISLGGPLGNRNAGFKSYLKWCTQKISWYKPALSLQVEKWLDIFNKDDPICSDPLLGYSRPRGVTECKEFVWAGKPSIFHPMEEHSAYFESLYVYTIIRRSIINVDESLG